MRISGHQHERSRDRSERDQAVMAKHDVLSPGELAG
jgi:hypothetical protein